MRWRLLTWMWSGQRHRGRCTRPASRESSSWVEIAANVLSKFRSIEGEGTADSRIHGQARNAHLVQMMMMPYICSYRNKK
jgi:hypothetical protein